MMVWIIVIHATVADFDSVFVEDRVVFVGLRVVLDDE